MEPKEADQFTEAMILLAEALDIEISSRRIELYWRVLKKYPWATVETALLQALHRKWFRFPQAGELIELIEGTPSERQDEAEVAWRQMWKALDHGTYRSLFCEDRVLAQTIRDLFGNWPATGDMPRADSEHGPMYQVRHKEFLMAYTNLSRQGRAYEPYLQGRIEFDNTPAQLIEYGQGKILTYLPKYGEPEAVERLALMPDDPLTQLIVAQERKELPAAESDV